MQKLAESLKQGKLRVLVSIAWMLASFMGIEVFMRHYVCNELIFPWIFSAIWTVLLTALVWLFPRWLGRIVYGLVYFVFVVYAVAQSGYYLIFNKMMWLTDLAYAGDGAEFASSIFGFLTKGFYISIVLMLAIGIGGILLLPKGKRRWYHRTICLVVCLLCCVALYFLPAKVFEIGDKDLWGAQEEWRRSSSLEGTYETMYDARKVYRICGVYQVLERDVYKHVMYKHLPAYQAELARNTEEINEYFDEYHPEKTENDMTGVLEGKNVILILLESMDDWMIDEQTTPNICALMEDGLNFTNMYTPGYGGVRTFNTEFCVNTGVFLPTDGNLAFSYCTNDFSESMPNLFRDAGYSAESFHYNAAVFYNRNVMHPAMGYEQHVSFYNEYVQDYDVLLNENYMFENEALCSRFFGGDNPDQPFFTFYITRSAHMPYTYDDVLSAYALEKYPEYRGMTGHEEVDCLKAKAKLVDDMFGELMQQLETNGQLENTAIIAFTDHYTYGMTDKERLWEESGIDNELLVEKTPFFIWADGLEPQVVDKTVNTSDILPTVLNLFGMETDASYLGNDIFDEAYPGYVIFSSGDWLTKEVLYRDGSIVKEMYDGASADVDTDAMNALAEKYVNVSNLLLKCNYYAEEEKKDSD